MHRNIARYILLALLVLSGGYATAREKTAEDADRLAIDKFNKSMVEAFENRDAAAIAANWTEQGEFVHNDGDALRGRAAIQQGYAEYFKTLTVKFDSRLAVDFAFVRPEIIRDREARLGIFQVVRFLLVIFGRG